MSAGTLPRLSPATLARLPADVRQPGYTREALAPGIVHLGIGNFARAFLVAQTDAALAAGGTAWGIVGVSLQRPDVREALAPQGGLYALAERDAAGETLRVPGALLEVVFADGSDEVEARIAAPSTRIVSLTITEKGYAGDGPRDALPTLLRGLARRHRGGQGPVTVLSLDNLSRNGEHVRARLLALADSDPPLRQWLAACRFPCSMVDRIVPATTDADRDRIAARLGLRDAWPVMAEPFLHWVLEDDFAAGRPAWPGVTAVSDAAAVGAWEAAKLRVVNGAHSALAYLGVAAGWATVDAAMAAPGMRDWLRGFLRHEVWPALGRQAPDAAYGEQVLARFANPALAHRTAQIAMDGSKKLPLRLVPTLAACLRDGRSAAHTALALAAWLQYQRGRDDAGNPQPVVDPAADELAGWQVRAQALPTAQARAGLWAGFRPVFGDLAGDPRVVALLGVALERLERLGAAACIVPMASKLP